MVSVSKRVLPELLALLFAFHVLLNGFAHDPVWRPATSRCTRRFVSLSSFTLVVEGFGIVGALRCYPIIPQPGGVLTKRVFPAEARKAGEVAVGGVQYSAMLDRDRRNLRITHQWAGGASL